jgi:hypothetical protein
VPFCPSGLFLMVACYNRQEQSGLLADVTQTIASGIGRVE